MTQFPGASFDKKSSDRLGWIVAGSVIGLFVVIFAVIGLTSGSSDDEPYDPNWSGEAIAQCEDLITQDLKSPSTAVFDSTATGSGSWTVTGTVDAENSFGATIRSEYQCSVIIDGDSIKRKLDYLE